MRTLPLRLCVCLLAGFIASQLTGCGTSSGWTRNTFARQSYKRGDYTAARRGFEQALIDNPYNANYAFNVAAAMQKQGDHLAAERMYNHALTLNPSHQPSYHALAGLLKEQGRTSESQELISAWVDTQPYMPEAHVEMAYLQQQNGDLAAAEASLQEALRRNPRHARATAQLGQVYQRTGRSPEAAAMYRRSLAMNRYQPQVYSQLNGMQTAGYPSPAMTMAQQMPYRDPSLSPFPAYATPPQQSGMVATGTPYTTFMPSMVGQMQPIPMQAAPLMTNSQMLVPGASSYPSGWTTTSQPFFSGATQVTMPGQQFVSPQMVPQPTLVQGSPLPSAIPTTVTPMLAPQMGTPTMVPGGTMIAPQPVQLGAPVPVSANPALVPTMAVMPVVSAF